MKREANRIKAKVNNQRNAEGYVEGLGATGSETIETKGRGKSKRYRNGKDNTLHCIFTDPLGDRDEDAL